MGISRKQRHLGLGIALGSLVLVGATACGSNEATDPQSAASAGDASSATPSTVATVAPADDPQELLGSIGDAMSEAGSVHVAMTAASTKAQGDMSFGDGGLQIDVTVTIPGMSGEMALRRVDGKNYLSIPQVTGEGKFAEIDASNKSVGQLFGMFDNLDPSKTYSGLSPAVTSMKDLGAQTIDGDATEHYALVIDVKKASEAADLGVEIPQGALDKLPKTYTYNLYVDSDDLVRRVDFTLMGNKTVMDYTAWGADVSISAPPAADVVPLPKGM